MECCVCGDTTSEPFVTLNCNHSYHRGCSSLDNKCVQCQKSNVWAFDASYVCFLGFVGWMFIAFSVVLVDIYAIWRCYYSYVALGDVTLYDVVHILCTITFYFFTERSQCTGFVRAELYKGRIRDIIPIYVGIMCLLLFITQIRKLKKMLKG